MFKLHDLLEVELELARMVPCVFLMQKVESYDHNPNVVHINQNVIVYHIFIYLNIYLGFNSILIKA